MATGTDTDSQSVEVPYQSFRPWVMVYRGGLKTCQYD